MVLGIKLDLRGALQFAELAALAFAGLLSIKRCLMLRLDRRARRPLTAFQRVQCFGAGDQFRVLIGQLRGAPRRQPVAEGFARRGVSACATWRFN